MNRKRLIKLTLIGALFFLALGGWSLHFRIHPPMADNENLVPFISGIFGIIVLPLLFWFRPTVTLAYIINGFTAILGTIIMAHFSLANFGGPLSLYGLMFKTTLPDIFILWGKFSVGKALFDLEFLKSDQDQIPKGRYFRYPNTGWWLVHLFAWSVVYVLGNLLWQ